LDKEEYRQKLDELTGYVGDKDYANALQIVEEIDWRRVKNINTLSMVAEVYEINKNYKKAKEILILALGRASIGKNILYRLVEVCLKLGENEEAEKYFRDYSKVARNDNSRCILQYKLYKAKKAPIEAQINVLEEYREREYTERWAYELTTLYAKAGDTKRCVEACDDLILWFSDGE
jgi:tetratricopeptide (TPR) repeat protein